MSYLQIYQEKIYDLLNNAASSKIDLTIREHPQKGWFKEELPLIKSDWWYRVIVGDELRYTERNAPYYFYFRNLC